MRKWMSEKLKRRKKPPQDPAAEKQPAPLQPAYFESAPQEPRTESPAPEPTPEPQATRTSEPASATPVNSSAEAGNPSAINARRPRPRRGRGGRPGRRHEGLTWTQLAKGYGYEVHGVVRAVPLEVRIERHQRRGRIV